MSPSTPFRAMLWLGLALSTGCASVFPTPPTGSSTQEGVASLTDWTATGKIALRQPGASESANLVWEQQGSHTLLRLSGPLGLGNTLVESDGSMLTIARGDERQRIDISSRAAIIASTGWDLPLQALPHWLRGLPSPDYPVDEATRSSADGALESLQQDGWRISYQRYGNFNGLTLPTRLRIEGHNTLATLLIRSWQLADRT
ncbi:MAG: lipoprotein insertase outer membrane protein LolB [Pseudomonadota bacterium]